MGVNYWRFVLQKKKLLDVVRDKIRFKHYSISTERDCRVGKSHQSCKVDLLLDIYEVDFI
jgi:hypothetical protein